MDTIPKAIRAEDHLRLAYKAAALFCRRLRLCDADRDDAAQEAALALVLAARDYDPSHPRANWKAFALSRINWTLRRWLNDRPIIHGPYQSYAPPPSMHSLESPRAVRAALHEEDPTRGLIIEELLVALSRLPQEQRSLLMRRYGLEGERETLEAIGREEGVDRRTIHARQKAAEKKLRKLAS